MSNKFAQNVIKELNKFRSNPKSIQHQCELIHKGLSRLRANDPFLNEIQSFVNQLESIKPAPELKYNEVLSEAAKKELPNFRGKSNYQRYRTNNIKGIVPDYYLEANPALVADDGADEPINVLTKTLLNRLDKAKEGRAILCDRKYTQVGIAHEVFDEENMVILIFATKAVENKPIKTTKNDFIMNIKYYESKNIKKPKYQTVVHHRIRGEIFGGDNFVKTNYEKQIYSQGGNRPNLESKKDGNDPTLRGNKSELKMKTKYSSRTTAPPVSKTRTRFPETVSAKNEKVQETSIKRRNDGTSSKTETKTKTETTTSKLRGKPEETTSSTTKTTTTRIKGGRFGRSTKDEEPKKVEETSTTITITKTAKRFSKGNDDAENVKKETKTVIKVEKGDEKNETTTTKTVKKFTKTKNEPEDNKVETKTVNKVEEKDEANAGGPSIRRKYGKKNRF